jgi:hypothetical protein
VKYSEYFGAKRRESFKNENIRYDTCYSFYLFYYPMIRMTHASTEMFKVTAPAVI